MDTPHDKLAKDILDVMLDDLGTFEREFEVPSLRPQRSDVRFAPVEKHTPARRALGLLGRMTDAACLFEPFHEAPSRDEVERCLRKLLNARHAGTLDEKRAVERMWLLCGGRPDDAIATLHAQRTIDWPAGFYELRGLDLAIVVLAELPASDDTLALRLLGAGATFRAALDDLRTRYGQVPRGEALRETVIQEFLAAGQRGAPLTENDMVDTSEARALMDDLWKRGLSQGISQGLSEGLSQGQLLVLTQMFQRRLGRPLTDIENTTLTARFHALGHERLSAVVLDLDATALAAWLADPSAN